MINDIHNKLRAVRREKNFSQEYMALYTDISQKAYSKYETGETKMSEDYLIKFANALGVSKEYIENKETYHPSITKNNCNSEIVASINSIENHNKKDNELLKSVLSLMNQMQKSIETNNELLKQLIQRK